MQNDYNFAQHFVILPIFVNYRKILFHLVTLTSQFHQLFACRFLPIFFHQNELQTQTVSIEKLRKTLSYEKAARKMLVKLAAGEKKEVLRNVFGVH